MDAIVIPVGGGGLIAGVALAVKTMKPDVLIIGVEPEVTSRNLGAQQWAQGHSISTSGVPQLQDCAGGGPSSAGAHPGQPRRR